MWEGVGFRVSNGAAYGGTIKDRQGPGQTGREQGRPVRSRVPVYRKRGAGRACRG